MKLVTPPVDAERLVGIPTQSVGTSIESSMSI